MPEGEQGETSGVGETIGNPFTEEDRQRTRERRQRHYTKRWYEKQLLAIANGELVLTKEQHKALIVLGRIRGWKSAPAGQKITKQTCEHYSDGKPPLVPQKTRLGNCECLVRKLCVNKVQNKPEGTKKQDGIPNVFLYLVAGVVWCVA